VFVSNTYETLSATQAAMIELDSIPGQIAEDTANNEGAGVASLLARAEVLQGQLIGALLHFPTHANVIKQASIEAGAEIIANLPELGAPDQTQATAVSFILERL